MAKIFEHIIILFQLGFQVWHVCSWWKHCLYNIGLGTRNHIQLRIVFTEHWENSVELYFMTFVSEMNFQIFECWLNFFTKPNTWTEKKINNWKSECDSIRRYPKIHFSIRNVCCSPKMLQNMTNSQSYERLFSVFFLLFLRLPMKSFRIESFESVKWEDSWMSRRMIKGKIQKKLSHHRNFSHQNESFLLSQEQQKPIYSIAISLTEAQNKFV